MNTRSIKVAFNYAKSFVKKIDPCNTFFNQNLVINLSVIENNSFIDFGTGGSAGCVYATIFISLALKKPISQNLAMTGQISTKGKIGKVGGIDS